MKKDQGDTGFVGIRVSGGGDNNEISGNTIKISGHGAGIVVEAHEGGNNHLKVNRNTIEHTPRPVETVTKQKDWFDTYWVDVMSGLTVVILGVFCAWLGLKA